MLQRARLLRAARKGDRQRLEGLLATGADPESKNWRGFTALMLAARRGHAAAVETLLAAGADPNRRTTLHFLEGSHRGVTPLLTTCESDAGNRNVVVTLIRAGADVNATDDRGTPPLFQASLSFQFEVVGALIEANADVNQDWDGVPILTVLVEIGWWPFIEWLLRAGADPNRADSDGRTPLMQAARQGDLKHVEMLLAFGADRLAQDAEGRSVAWYARRAPWRARRKVRELLDL